jgi:hypothetical protein
MREINDRLYMFRYNAIFFNATYEKYLSNYLHLQIMISIR